MADADFGVPTNESYFADEYLGYSVGVGIFWIVGAITPILCQEFWLKTDSFYEEVNGTDQYLAWDSVSLEFGGITFYPTKGLTTWTKIAW